jgi:hypothetical protein
VKCEGLVAPKFASDGLNDASSSHTHRALRSDLKFVRLRVRCQLRPGQVDNTESSPFVTYPEFLMNKPDPYSYSRTSTSTASHAFYCPRQMTSFA